MKRIHTKALHILICLMSSTMAGVKAETLNWNGFVSQGLIQAQDSNFVNSDGDLSFELTEIGLNASYRLNQNLRLAGQVVYLNGGNRYREGVRIDYLFLDWQLQNSLNWQVNLHLGRYKNYHWLYSSTRDVPHTRPSIILPQSSYIDVFRDVALGQDGIALKATTSNDFGDWEANWSYGVSDISTEQMKNLLTPLARGELEQDFDHQMSLSWTPVSGVWRVGINLLDSDFTYQPGANDVLFQADVTTQRLMLNLSYFSEHWELASELVKERVIFNGGLFPGFVNDATAEGGFVQWRYFVSPKQTLLVRLDLFDRNNKDRNGTAFEATTGGAVPAYFGFMDQATLGYSWDFAKDWRLQAEYHRVKGTGRLAPIIVPDTLSNNNKYWDMWAIQIMHWF